MRVEGSPLLHSVCRATVTRVSERTPTSGTEWVRRMSRGSVASGYEYVLEDATGNRLATSKYSWLGFLKQIEPPGEVEQEPSAGSLPAAVS